MGVDKLLDSTHTIHLMIYEEDEKKCIHKLDQFVINTFFP